MGEGLKEGDGWRERDSEWEGNREIRRGGMERGKNRDG